VRLESLGGLLRPMAVAAAVAAEAAAVAAAVGRSAARAVSPGKGYQDGARRSSNEKLDTHLFVGLLRCMFKCLLSP